MNDSQIVPLQQLYLLALCGVAESNKLTPALQDLGNDRGRLYLLREGTTAPDVVLAFEFRGDCMTLAATTRDAGRTMDWTVFYGEGVDAVLPELHQFINANRLAAPKRRVA
jgi:hypothetical protein